MSFTPEQKLGILARDVFPLVKAVVEGFEADAGEPQDYLRAIEVRILLSDYCRAVRLKAELEKML